MRIIKFFDGVESSTTPTIGNIKASGIIEYPNDAAYEAAEAGSPVEGNIYFNTTTDLIRYYNGTAWINLVDESSPQTLTFKSMDGDLNTFTDISLSSLKTILADANKFVVRNALGEVVSLKTVPTGEVVGTTDAQTLTFKTIDADNNNITNLDNDNIKALAGIEVTKLSDGSVSDAEFKALDGVTSNIQTQLNGKQSTSEKNQPNGYAGLDGAGKVPAAQLPNSVMELQGFFDPATTTLIDGTGNPGDVWEASVAGSHNFGSGVLTFNQGDWVVYAADLKWHKSINSNEVVSVAGKKGAVNLVIDDMTDVDTTTSAPVLGQIIQYDGSKWVNVTPTFGSTTLAALTDVQLTGLVAGQKLKYNGTKWVNITDNIDSLNDVDTTTLAPNVGQGLVWNGTNWVPGTVAGQGDINFISNYDFEVNTNGYNLYKDAVQSRPVDGTGGTPSGGLSIARSTTNPLKNTASLVVSKNNTNCQGEGFSVDFTIDDMFKAKVLNNEFAYKVLSGTFTAGAPGVDSDIIMYLYNITDGVLVEPTSLKLFSNSTSISDRYMSTFQTSATGTQYRLIFHVATTSTAPWSIMIDEVKVSPSKYVYGTPITDWNSYTPQGSFTTNTSYTGRWRRVGDSIEVQAKVSFTGAPNATQLTLTLPNGLVVDTTKSIISSEGNSMCGGLFDQSTGTIYLAGGYTVPGSNSIGVRVWLANGTYASHVDISNVSPVTIANGDNITVNFTAPIVGWTSTVQMSDTTSLKVVNARAVNNVNQTIPNTLVDTVLSANTVAGKDAGNWNTTTNRYTVTTEGSYFVSAQALSNVATWTAGNILTIKLRVTGVVQTNAYDNALVNGTYSTYVNIDDVFELKAGDYIDVVVAHNRAGGSLDMISFNCPIKVYRLSGPSAIAASEKINCRYENQAGTSVPNTGLYPVPFATKSYDTHNAFSGGLFTAPVVGKYKVHVNCYYTTATWTISSKQIRIRKNGVTYSIPGIYSKDVANNQDLGLNATDTVFLLAGETLGIEFLHNESGGRALASGGVSNIITIEKVD